MILGGWRFFSADPTALSYILSHPDQFPKPDMARKQMTEILGNGVLIAEGADHRRQRKILNPSFSQAAVRDMTPIFYDKSYELKEKLLALIADESIEAAPTPAKPEDKVQGGKKIDVMRYLGQTTLDVIGIAGFAYDFKSLSTEDNELAEAYRKMFSQTQSITKLGIAQAIIPGLGWIVS
jgi:cytochrome P450